MPLDLSLELNAGVPVRGAAGLGQDEGWQFLPALLLSRTFGPVLVSAEARALVRASAALGQATISDGITVGAAATTLGKTLRGELTLLSDIPFKGAPASLEILAGGRWLLPLGWKLFAAKASAWSSTRHC